MHVTSPCPCRCRSMRRPFAAVLMLALAGAGSIAQAAGFDERLKAPMMKDAAQTAVQAKEFGARFREVRAATPSQVITNASLARENFDFRWQVERAIDHRKPIKEFEELGFQSLGNGSYKVNLDEHPEWEDVPRGIISILSVTNLDPVTSALVERGFRPEDVIALKDYLRSHDARVAAKAASLPVALGFANSVRKFDKASRPVPDALVISYLYQTSRAASEAERLWVVELLNRFDAQRRRVLLATLMEFEVTGEWHPSDPAQVIASQLNAVRLPNFEELARAEAKGVAP